MQQTLMIAVALAVGLAACGSDDPGSNIGTESVRYEVTFQATWSAATHPDDFPGNPHFSGLIGAVHSDRISFWAEGQPASAGMKNMAETGGKEPLDGEVAAAIDAGTGGALLSGGGIGTSPGSVSLAFEVSEDYPLVTLVSMVAPSPDWFVGVSGVDLREGSGWAESRKVDLVVYDAGTDSGASYGSPDAPTSPQQTIMKLMTSPFDAVPVLGTFTFSRKQ